MARAEHVGPYERLDPLPPEDARTALEAAAAQAAAAHQRGFVLTSEVRHWIKDQWGTDLSGQLIAARLRKLESEGKAEQVIAFTRRGRSLTCWKPVPRPDPPEPTVALQDAIAAMAAGTRPSD